MSAPGHDSRLEWLDRLGLNALSRRLNPRPLVLAYPRLAEGSEEEGFPLPLFKRQLAALHVAGFRFADMDDFAEALAHPRPGRLVVLTFAGGLRNTVRLAYPAMKMLGAKGILYVAPERVPAAPLPEGWGPDAPASWGELRALDPAVLQVGNHGRSSIDCSAVAGEQAIEREIWRSGLDIEQQLGYPVRHFACPPGGEGLFDPVRLAAFGYASVLIPAAGMASSGRDPFSLRALEPERSLSGFKAQISGTLDWIKRSGARRPSEPVRPAPIPEPMRARATAAGAQRTAGEMGGRDEFNGEQPPRRQGGDQSRR
jgi:peptidoglycan/xylan/chitin deacetylase (PgdA/CDA1 family)